MVLVQERPYRLLLEHGHVLTDRVLRLNVARKLDDIGSILDAENLEHVPVQLAHVVELWCLLCHLQCSLVLHDALGHGGSVWIRYRDDIDSVVKVLKAIEVAIWIVLVLLIHEVLDDASDEAELLVHRRMDTSLNARHDLHVALEQCKGCANRCLSVHVADLHVGNGADASTLFDEICQELVQDARWFLVGKERDGVTDRSARHIDVTELAGTQRSVVALDAKTAGLEASRKVGKGASINELTQDRGC